MYWSFGAEEFVEEQQQSVPLSSESSSLDLALDVAEGQLLRFRIDPLIGRGKSRLRGSISGAFDLVSEDGARLPRRRLLV